MRIYDNRLGRFLSVDPISNKYPELSPFQFASNSCIAGIDLDGLELAIVVKQIYTSSCSNEQVYFYDLPEDRDVYEQILSEALSKHNLCLSDIPQDAVMTIEVDYTHLEGGRPTESISFGAKQIEIVEDRRTVTEKFKGGLNRLDSRYWGEAGKKHAYEDFKNVGIVGMKCMGVIQLLLPGFQSSGYATLEAAESLDNLTMVVDGSSDIKNGNYSKAVKVGIGIVITNTIGNRIDEAKSLPEHRKTASNLAVDFVIDNLTEGSDENETIKKE